MKRLLHLLIVPLAFSTIATAQNPGDWSAVPFVSNNFMFGDTDFNHPTKAMSPGAGFQLQYTAYPNLQVYGDLTFGSANGGNSSFYFETQFLQGSLGLQYDVFGAISNDWKLQGNIDLSLGWSYLQAVGFDAATNNLIAKVPYEGGYSSAPVLGLGGNLSYPLSNQVDIMVGYRMYKMYDHDWVDARKAGEHDDYIGQAFIGVRFALNGHTPMAEVTQEDYDDLVAAKRKAEQDRDEAQEELETSRRRYDAQIEDLYNVLSIMNNNIDSLNEKITVLRSNPNATNSAGVSEYTVNNPDGSSSADASNAMWRIVIGSFPTAEGAREFADRKPVQGGDYKVVFIEDLRTYRVVYNSYETLAAAKADLTTVRHVIGEAWIIKF